MHWSRVLFNGMTLYIKFFLFAGFQCEEHDNPADFFLDVVTFSEKSGNHGNINGNGNGCGVCIGG